MDRPPRNGSVRPSRRLATRASVRCPRPGQEPPTPDRRPASSGGRRRRRLPFDPTDIKNTSICFRLLFSRRMRPITRLSGDRRSRRGSRPRADGPASPTDPTPTYTHRHNPRAMTDRNSGTASVYDWWSRHPGALEVLYALAFLGRESAFRGRSLAALDPQSGERVLEVGCGTGNSLGPLREGVAPDGRSTPPSSPSRSGRRTGSPRSTWWRPSGGPSRASKSRRSTAGPSSSPEPARRASESAATASPSRSRPQ